MQKNTAYLVIVAVCVVIVIWKWPQHPSGISVQFLSHASSSSRSSLVQDVATSSQAEGSRCQASARVGWSWSEMEHWHEDFRRQQRRYWNDVVVRDKGEYSFQRIKSLIIQGMLPTYTCPLHRRYGGVADGGKTLCDPHCTLARPGCLIYSFGVGTTCSFENQLWREHPNCEIHLFDPTPGLEQSFHKHNLCTIPKGERRLSFHPWGLGGFQNSTSINGKKVDLLTLPQVKRRLGHDGRTLDILKVDVEGSEFDAFEYLFGKKELSAIHLLLLEVHMGGKLTPNLKPVVPSSLFLMRQLEANSFRLYHLERNPYLSFEYFEAAFVNKTMLSLL